MGYRVEDLVMCAVGIWACTMVKCNASVTSTVFLELVGCIELN